MVEAKLGRPRSEATRHAILRAAAGLVDEIGYANITTTAIATRAGAGKQTIYRWWRAKSSVIADAVVEGYLRLPSADVAVTGSLEDDLKAWLHVTVQVMNDAATGPMVRALAAAASDDAAQATALWDHLTGPLHRDLLNRLERGQHAGQLSAAVDSAAIADALLGTVLFRLLAQAPNPARLDGIVDAVLGASRPAG
ncbi:TetR/AcrR family transcriptional regulator [Mycetocola zhadangensis]|uniref:TetR/AcrR family transcriptional regulator n=1 Tax=Mycetocola zhadangensis TaxID=1164595 RepID=A0A3L7J7G7_9MICO|nr:TetR/AcrR family transcriptional regulator [Mycetocola zhadangensis]RLQ86364.1 TetR/AcrR family transcriptional regulator [Mycetocola zhadangensis]GGE90586.1 TetR family transcriptional regulator [Mycetocola zhadangensis]